MKPRIAAGIIGLFVATQVLAQIPKMLPEQVVAVAKMADEVYALTKDASISISPGTSFQIDGKSVRVFGNEWCPDVTKTLVFYIGKQTSGGSGCTIITPKTNNIIVQRETSKGLMPEVWRVDRNTDDQIRLWTMNGKPVLPDKE
jgi:hypothetical protein